MARHFHVDRGSQLQAGQVLNLVRYINVNPSEAQAMLNDLWPDGLTPHGHQYVVGSNSTLGAVRPAPSGEPTHEVVFNPTLEVVWELVRQLRHPAMPSRYQSVFAWETLAGARQFQQRFPPAGVVWEVEAGEPVRRDMNMLGGQTALAALWLADAYWRGDPNPSGPSWWELLLSPPVRVLRRVDDAEVDAAQVST